MMLDILRRLPYWQRLLGIMFVASLVSAMGFGVTFPFLPLYVESLGTHTDISLSFWAGMVYSGQAFAMMIASPFWGAVADRYGRKLMMQRALFGGTFILGAMAFVHSAEQLVLLRTAQGFITGTIGAANALVAAVVPRERMGYAMGVLQVGLWGGVAIGPMIGGPLADAFGFRVPHLVTAGLLCGAGLLVQFGVREDFTRKVASKGKSFVGDWRYIFTMPGVAQTYSLSFLGAISRTMLTPVSPLFIAALMAGGISMSAVNFAAVEALIPGARHLMSGTSHAGTMTGLVIGVSSAAATFSAVYFGRLGDRIGHRRILIGCGIAALCTYIPQVFVTEAWQLIVLQGLTGLASGGLVSAPSALLARYTEPGMEGAVYGIDNSVVSGGRAVAPLLGSMIAAWMGYRVAFASVIVVYGLIVTFSALLLPKRTFVYTAKQPPVAVVELQPEAAGD